MKRQIKPEWQENSEFDEIVERILADRWADFPDLNADDIGAYNCINKDRPEDQTVFRVVVDADPHSNSRTALARLYASDWQVLAPEENSPEFVTCLIQETSAVHSPRVPGPVRQRRRRKA